MKQQYDILQRHRINLTDEEMSEFTEIFKVIEIANFFFLGKGFSSLLCYNQQLKSLF